MANVRDSDTSLWLHNKLGTSNDLWSGGSICSQLSQDVLRNIKECFIDLQAQVKLKLLLSFMHIPRRNTDEDSNKAKGSGDPLRKILKENQDVLYRGEVGGKSTVFLALEKKDKRNILVPYTDFTPLHWKVELEEILELAVVDSDQWVSMLAELLKSYPSTGTVNMEIEENVRVFTDLLSELKKLVKKNSDLGMVPMECLYLNKNALTTIVGQQLQPAKHFALKRKPKSAALRAELLQKSSDAANNLKKNVLTPGVPLRSRSLVKRMDDSTPLKGFSSRTPLSSFRSPPAGIRRLTSTPALPSRALPKTPAGRKDGGIKLLEITEQPIGFGREAKRRKKLTDDANELLRKEKEIATDSSPTSTTTPEYAAGLVASSITQQLPTPSTPLSSLPTASTGTTPAVSLLSNSPTIVTIAATATTTTASASPISATIQTRENLQQTLQVQATRLQAAPSLTIVTTANPQQPSTPTTQSSLTTVQATVQVVTSPKRLSLTRERMQEAQEMFRTANKVTRPEKALILGFMAGSRDNPCPHLGNLVTIKLSENQENVTQPDGSQINMIVEMHFQMNYNTGEWKRVRKLRKLEE